MIDLETVVFIRDNLEQAYGLNRNPGNKRNGYNTAFSDVQDWLDTIGDEVGSKNNTPLNDFKEHLSRVRAVKLANTYVYYLPWYEFKKRKQLKTLIKNLHKKEEETTYKKLIDLLN